MVVFDWRRRRWVAIVSELWVVLASKTAFDEEERRIMANNRKQIIWRGDKPILAGLLLRIFVTRSGHFTQLILLFFHTTREKVRIHPHKRDSSWPRSFWILFWALKTSRQLILDGCLILQGEVKLLEHFLIYKNTVRSFVYQDLK
jgi:hypothetical protein